MTLWAVYASEEDTAKWPVSAHAVISNKTREVEWTIGPTVRGLEVTREEHSWVSHIPSPFRYPIQGGETIEVSIKMNLPLKVKTCGIHLGQSEQYESNVYLPSKEVPDWFSHQRMGSSVSFDMPLHLEHQFLGMTLWAVYAAEEDRTERIVAPQAIFSNKTSGDNWMHMPTSRQIPVTHEEHSWVSHIPKSYFPYPIKGGERIEISIKRHPPLKVKKYGIHLGYKTNITEEDRGQSSCLNADNRDELMDDMNLKRGRDVETSCDLSNEDKFHKRMGMEPDQTKNLDTELDQLKK
ncbi:hypothetical protein F0562_000044 [Nyssa sinensis]|uniref:C-JID domain-containing protein n=1 Tax=Nyssa sinensis TaxID=561372 RepID=A0A5J5C2H3_9ASTE|nr:hypothetical protein F0562_000044 [Nyssa sinensis]